MKIRGIQPFAIDYIRYREEAKRKEQPLRKWKDLSPYLDDCYQESGNLPEHYFYQDLWAVKLVYQTKPEVHFGIGSSIHGFIAHVSIFNKVKVFDIRPQSSRIENVDFIQGDITDLKIQSGSIPSLSCLHAADHIGLGRYGDRIDARGTEKAVKELQRVLAGKRDLYFSLPVGRERICFNAHRVSSPQRVLAYFDELLLVSFSVVDDSGTFRRGVNPDDYEQSEYACGLFHFRKQKREGAA